MATFGCEAAAAALKAGQEALLTLLGRSGSQLRKPVSASQASRLPPLSLPRRPILYSAPRSKWGVIDPGTKIGSSKSLSGSAFQEFR